MMLRDSLVSLRALEAEDLDFLYLLENDAALWNVSDSLVPMSRYSLRQYLDHASASLQEVRQLRLVICAADDGRAVGTLDLFDYDARHARAGVGIAILRGERQRGFARASLSVLATYAHQTLLLHQLYCTVGADNAASHKLFQAAGFMLVGTRKDWLQTTYGWQNAVEYQLLLNS
jgi:diamine N-acetyltransferase